MRMQLGVLIFLGVISAISASFHEVLLALIWSAILLLVFVFSGAERRSFYIALGWGILLTTCSWIGWHGVSLISLLSIVALRLTAPSSSNGSARAMMPVFLFGCGTLLAEVVTGLGFLDTHRSFFGLGWELPHTMWRDSFHAFLDVWTSSWQWMFRITLFILSTNIFRSCRTCRLGFVKGIWLGASIAGAYTVTQWLHLHKVALPNQTALWSTLRRWSGLSSDPNAQGILFGLALWVGVYIERARGQVKDRIPQLTLISAGLIVSGGILTGSRTFFLIIGCMGVALLSRAPVRMLGLVVLSVCSISLSITALDYYDKLDPLLAEMGFLPEGLVRLISSGSIVRVGQTFSSRLIFTSLSIQVISDNWLFGVGPDRFINYVSLYGRSIPSLGAWIDNANNFYLGVFAECGFFGFIAMFCAVFLHRLASGNAGRTARFNLLMLAIILLIGPHTDFIEVLIVFAMLTAVSTREINVPVLLHWFGCLGCLVMGFLGVQFREMGVYRWEHENSQVVTRWLSPYAKILVPCTRQHDNRLIGELVLQASYIPSTESIRTHISSSHIAAFSTSFSDTVPKRILVDCPAGFDSLLLSVASEPAWRPYRAWPKKTDDARVLSVKQVMGDDRSSIDGS